MDQGGSIAALVIIVSKEKVMKIIKFDIKKYMISEKICRIILLLFWQCCVWGYFLVDVR